MSTALRLRLPEEITLEKRLQALATYAPDAWELWSEVPSPRRRRHSRWRDATSRQTASAGSLPSGRVTVYGAISSADLRVRDRPQRRRRVTHSRRSAPARRTVPSWSSPTAICWKLFRSRSRRGPPPRSITPHIDLHCHSTASDGECEPQEVARRAPRG